MCIVKQNNDKVEVMAIEGLNEVLRSESTHGTKVDVISTIEEYVNQTDWRVNANSNSGGAATHPALINTSAGKIIANYWLDKVYTKAEGDAHRNGDYHIHDLDNLSGYCCGHDLAKLLNEGFNGVVGRVGSKAPKHVREALNQMANYIGILQAEWAGAQAFSSFDTYLAPLVFFDKFYDDMSYDDLKKAIRNFVYNLNVPSRWGQSPFSNVTIDLKCPKDLRERTPMRDDLPFFVSVYNELKEDISKGKELYDAHGDKSIADLSKLPEDDRRFMRIYDGWQKLMAEAQSRLNDYESDDETLCYSLTYKCFHQEMQEVMRAYYEVMSEGDAFGLPFTFPIPTVNITEDFDWDNPAYEVLWDNTAKYGCSYFQNFIGSQYLRDENGELTIRNENAYSPDDVRSMAFLPNQKFNCRVNGVETTLTIKEMFTAWRTENPPKFEVLSHEHQYANVSEMFEIPYASYNNKAVAITLAGRETEAPFVVSIDHKCAVIADDGKYMNKLAQDVCVGDLIPVRKGDAVHGVAVTSVRIVDEELEYVYNFTIDTPEHLVELPNGIISPQCCRLQLDKREVKKRGGGLFGSDSQTGSIGVVTINMARIGYNFKGDEKGYMKRLFKLMDHAKSTLEKKRKFIKEMVLRGLYPYTRRYINSAKDGFTTFFSTIGINGMNESIRNFTNDEHDITDEWGQQFSKRVMTAIRERLQKYQDETGNIYNLEASPAEGTTYRFAKEDAKRYGTREVKYIECEKHGRVEVEVGDDVTEVECPLCAAEAGKEQ